MFRRNKGNLTETQMASLEAKWNEASKACLEELKEAQDMAKKADDLAATISEKHGIPIKWSLGGYRPESLSKWTASDRYTPEEQDFYEDLISDNCYFGEYSEPGEFWYPSRFC